MLLPWWQACEGRISTLHSMYLDADLAAGAQQRGFVQTCFVKKKKSERDTEKKAADVSVACDVIPTDLDVRCVQVT